MIKFLRKILYIQTIKLVLFNPDYVEMSKVSEAFKNLPVILIVSLKVDDVRVIDTGIPVKKKNEQ